MKSIVDRFEIPATEKISTYLYIQSPSYVAKYLYRSIVYSFPFEEKEKKKEFTVVIAGVDSKPEFSRERNNRHALSFDLPFKDRQKGSSRRNPAIVESSRFERNRSTVFRLRLFEALRKKNCKRTFERREIDLSDG